MRQSKFAGTEIKGKTLGIIGMGAIGGPLASAAIGLGMKVMGFDPFLSDAAKAALDPAVEIVNTRDEIYVNCDFITVHVPLIDDPDPDKNTKKMINAEKIAMMKDGVIILNLARGALVDDDAMAAALESGKVRKYVTDFPNTKSANMAGAIAIPHLGASTEEAEDNCAAMAVKQAVDFVENGNIVETEYDPYTNTVKEVSRKCYSKDANSPRAKVNCYGANDVCEGVAIMHKEGVDVSITGNSTNPTRFQHPVAGTYKKECTEQGKKYFSVASGGGTGRTLHPDNMAAGPASYGMTDTMGRMHSDAQFAGSSSVPAHVEMMGLIGAGNNPMVGMTVSVAVAVQEAADAGKF